MNLKQNYWGKALCAFSILFAVCQPVKAAPVELSLSDAVSLALKNNTAMKIVEENRDKMVWTVKEAKASTGINVSYTHYDTSSNAPPSWISMVEHPTVDSYKSFSNKISFTLPVYTGGKLESSIEQAKTGLKIADYNVDATKQQLRLNATNTYFAVLQTRNLQDIARQAVEAFTIHHQNVQKMYNEGVVPYLDVLQTKVQLANAEDRLLKAQNSYKLAVYDLNNIVGLPIHTETVVKEELSLPKDTLPIDDSIQYALTHRPEIAREQANIEIAKAGVKIASSDKGPMVSLVGNNTWFDVDFAGTKYKNWTVNLIAQMNVFDAGRTDAQIKQAEQNISIAKKQRQQMEDAVTLEVNRAYLSMTEAQKRLLTTIMAVEEAEANVNLAKVSYNAGVGTNVNVIDAELALAQARTNHIQAMYDYNTSKTQLDKSMGM